MDSALNDKRFANISKDPKFRRVPASTRKVTIDKRFNSMFNDKRFKLKYTVDKRGKPINLTSNEQLKDFYEIKSDEEEETDEEEDDEESEAEESDKEADEASEVQPSTSASKKKQIVSKFEVSSIEEGKKNKIETESSEVAIPDQVRTKLQDLNVDYARGEGLLFSDSSSDEEESTEEEEDDMVYHDWGELDKDAEETDTATKRLAVCNMDWDRIRAVDLLVLLNSFAPQGGSVQSVTIYPSEFGIQRMKEEEVLGPKELVETSKQRKREDSEKGNEDEGNDSEDEYHREKLRQYQLNRLKYYYAVAVCDSDTTAGKIYEECDGHEFESSAARLDLRFIPDDMEFDQAPRDVCDGMPDVSQYEPRIFMNSALQQAQVHLTWDETDPSRMQTMQKLFQGKNGKQKGLQIDDEALKGFLATSSEEEDEPEEEEEKPKAEEADDVDAASSVGESQRIAKYRSLLASLSEQEEKTSKKNRDMEMEITWGVGLKEKAEQMVKKKMAEKALETPWEQQLAKRREKRQAKKQEKKQQKQREVASGSSDEEEDDIPSDVDMNDPYFREEFEKEEFRRKDDGKTKKSKSKAGREKEKDQEEGADKAGELELLLMDENDGKRHFSLKSIMKEEGMGGKGKKNKKGKPTNEAVAESKEKDFKVQVDDPRFSALFTSHHFNLDPSDPNFRSTEGTMAILQEKQKRRITEDVPQGPSNQPESKMSKGDPELSRLVRSVKIKTSMQKTQQKYKSARP